MLCSLVIENTMHSTTHIPKPMSAPKGKAGGEVRVFRRITSVRATPVLSEQTRRTFEEISDVANAHLFTKDAARKAFAHIKV